MGAESKILLSSSMKTNALQNKILYAVVDLQKRTQLHASYPEQFVTIIWFNVIYIQN